MIRIIILFVSIILLISFVPLLNEYIFDVIDSFNIYLYFKYVIKTSFTISYLIILTCLIFNLGIRTVKSWFGYDKR